MQWAEWGHDTTSDPVGCRRSATEMDCVNGLYQLVEAMARSLEKVREPVGEQLQ
jgi:hypothetical protein